MGAAESNDLFPDLRNPEGIHLINERCLIRTQDQHRVVLVSGIVLAQYALSDPMAEAYVRVQLVDQGWATQSEVARAFTCSTRTVRRDQRRFEEGGLGALGRPDGYPSGRPRLTGSRRRLIEQLKGEGYSQREIARRIGVGENAVRSPSSGRTAASTLGPSCSRKRCRSALRTRPAPSISITSSPWESRRSSTRLI